MQLDSFMYSPESDSSATVRVAVTCGEAACDGASGAQPKPKVRKCKKNFKKVKRKCKKKRRRKR